MDFEILIDYEPELYFRDPIESLDDFFIFLMSWIDVIESLDFWLSVECELNLRDPTDPYGDFLFSDLL